MADVVFGYVYDFGPDEEWWATLGGGAYLKEQQLDRRARGAPGRDGGLRC